MIQGKRASNQQGHLYIPHNLVAQPGPLRESALLRRFLTSARLLTSDQRKSLGVTKRPSPLLTVPSVDFPRAFPVDTMHCILLNILPVYLQILNGTLPGFPMPLSQTDLKEMGERMSRAGALIPSSMGSAPRNISAHLKGFTASEWKAWLIFFCIPFLDGRVDVRVLDNLRVLRKVFLLATARSISSSQVSQIRDLCTRFVREYEAIHYQNLDSRLSACRINVHSLLHLADHVEDCGPATIFWQFLFER